MGGAQVCLVAVVIFEELRLRAEARIGLGCVGRTDRRRNHGNIAPVPCS
jgi:hypothetical protein